MSTLAIAPAPTERQVAFYNTLATERGLPTIPTFADGISRRQASEAIEALKAMPRQRAARTAPAPSAPAVEVADGRYAIDRTEALAALPGDDGTVFVKLNTGTRGRWEGFQFVDQLSGDNRIPVRDRALKAALLRAIAANPLEALARYGRELGRCGACDRRLTDDESRAMGIGPDCFQQRMGRPRVKADTAPYMTAYFEQVGRQQVLTKEDPGNAAEARLAEIETRPENNPPAAVPLHVLARMGAEEISGMEMNRDTGEFDRPLRTRDTQREEANRQAEAISADKRDRMKARIVLALQGGTEAWIIRDGIADDEDLTEAHKTELNAHLDATVAHFEALAAEQVHRTADARTAKAIAAAYAEGDTETGRRLEAEAGPDYVARQRIRFGF